MTNKILPFILITFCAFAATAQDVIVLRNGDIISAKVQKISKNEIEYKKASNLDGPTYTIEKNNVLAINYENGEKDQFDNTQIQSPEFDKNEQVSKTPKFVESTPSSNNQELINRYNSSIPRHKKNIPDQSL